MWYLVRNHLQKNNNIFPQMLRSLQPQEKEMYVQFKVRGAEAYRYTYIPSCRIFIYPPLFVDAFLSSYTEVNLSL